MTSKNTDFFFSVSDFEQTEKVKYISASYHLEDVLMFLKSNLSNFQKHKKKFSECFVLSNKCLLRFLHAWHVECSNLMLVDPNQLKRPNTYTAEEFLNCIKLQTMDVQDTLKNKSVTP